MAEYIEREAIIAHLQECVGTPPEIAYTSPIYKAIERFVKGLPTADVAPVVRGRWKPIKRKNLWGDETDTLECSACKKSDVKGRAIVRHSDFCPNCGARMDKEDG